jgi:putative nucleotidyltransferase with HDIG domain
MDFVLVVRKGESVGRKFTIANGDLKTIGRSEECEIRLPDQGVSRRHCTIENLGAVLRLVDLDSANGTYINERAVKEGALDAGDELWVGPTVLECRDRPAPARRAQTTGETTISFSEDIPTTVVTKVVDTQFPGKGALDAAKPANLEDLRRAQINLATAYEVSKMMASAPGLERLIDGVIDSIFAAINADRAALLLHETSDGSGELSVRVARSRNGDQDPEEITVSRTVVQDVLKRRVSSLSRDATADTRYKKGQSIIRKGIRSVMCAPVLTEDSVIGVLYADSRSKTGAFNESDLDLLALIGNLAGVSIHRARVEERAARLQRALEEFKEETIDAIVTAIDYKNRYTHAHSKRVAEFAARIAAELGKPEEEVEIVRQSGKLHDIGKMGVPDAILEKEGTLTAEETEEIKKHPLNGVDILSRIRKEHIRAILPGVQHHHEKWDGSGYPDNLSGEDIPELGRILAVADVLDALSSKRAYREALPFDEAVERIEQDAGSHFDPEVAAAAVALHARGELEVPQEPYEPELEPIPTKPGAGKQQK